MVAPERWDILVHVVRDVLANVLTIDPSITCLSVWSVWRFYARR
jgi:hypothetical protein